METRFFVKQSIIVLATALLSASTLTAQKNNFEPVTVIELFSSQGCSSCPPADALLVKTIASANKSAKKIFCLSFHVDYWNRLGWKDPFSDKKFSERQQQYAEVLKLNSVYTPQIVVNGNKEFVGSDENKLNKTISETAGTIAEAEFENTKMFVDETGTLAVSYHLKGNFKDCVINFALVSSKEITAIRRGENTGLTLTNENVVRQLITVDAAEKGELRFAKSPMPAAGNKNIIVYLQNKKTLKITAAIAILE